MQFARVYYSPKDSEWRRKNGERVPEECVELDPAKLRRASSNGTIYRYEGKLRP